jgi:hypothetical protein
MPTTGHFKSDEPSPHPRTMLLYNPFWNLFSVSRVVMVSWLEFCIRLPSPITHQIHLPSLYLTNNVWRRVQIMKLTRAAVAQTVQWLGYGLDDGVFDSRQALGFFSPRHCVQTGSGVTPLPIKWVSQVITPRVKQPRREADHSPSSSAGVKIPPPALLHGEVINWAADIFMAW